MRRWRVPRIHICLSLMSSVRCCHRRKRQRKSLGNITADLCPTFNSAPGDCPAPRDGVLVPGQHRKVCVQQHGRAPASPALAQERTAHQVVQTGQEPKPRGPAHQPAGAGGRGLLPVHSRERTGDSVRHCQADGHREGGSAQRSSPPDCHALLQHLRPAHLGETRAQLGPDHRLLRSLSASYGSVPRPLRPPAPRFPGDFPPV